MKNINITILDFKTLGNDLDFSIFSRIGDVKLFDITNPNEVEKRIENSDVIVVNKVNLNANNLKNVKNLKLICLASTGFDNVDINYCKKNNIVVCNVVGYSTQSVSEICVSMTMLLYTHLGEFNKYVKSKEYTKSGVQNKLEPVFCEFYGKTWGIIGLGNIGKQVAKVASAMGCNLLVYKQTKDENYNCVDIDELCEKSDIISIHLPLTPKTENLIDSEKIAKMKNGVIIVNVARGKITDEEALTVAVENKKIGGLGIDVYSEEPFSQNHPFNRILNYENVIFTPHMAWAAYESRVRLLNEICENIKSFYKGEIRNRV